MRSMAFFFFPAAMQRHGVIIGADWDRGIEKAGVECRQE